MSEQEPKQPIIMKPIKVSSYFPWITLLLSFSFVILIGFKSNNLFDFEHWVRWTVIKQNIEAAAILLILITSLFEYLIFSTRSKKTRNRIDHLTKEVQLYSAGKKKQQQRANQYSDHTEKLKGFIADKLIEYMDYDEKFIHFKGIAAEVRHNGVISYDKINTALNKAIEQQGFLSLYEQQNSDDELNQHTLNALVDYQSAIDAMRYLWALLDLSTADNMAMHIGNQLIDCEENYFRLQLDKNKSLDITQSIPIVPTFDPQLALLTTFSLLINESELNNRITLAKINPAITQDSFYFENQQFRILIDSCPELLGNPNHVILLLENLIKNAQFFTTKNRLKQTSDRINIRLRPKNSNVLFSIYNRGPHIQQDSLETIFQLGFSTRRNKEHHGKGLGLFFAKEIVRGYQGVISARNIEEQNEHYNLTIQLENNRVTCYPITCKFVNNRLQAKLLLNEEWLKEVTLTFDSSISSIEVTSLNKTLARPLDQILEEIEKLESTEWLDQSENMQKRWLIKVSNKKNSNQLIFKPLSIAGVQFEIELPTAESHLDA